MTIIENGGSLFIAVVRGALACSSRAERNAFVSSSRAQTRDPRTGP